LFERSAAAPLAFTRKQKRGPDAAWCMRRGIVSASDAGLRWRWKGGDRVGLPLAGAEQQALKHLLGAPRSLRLS
jgi:hypothetical protein